MLDVNLMSHLMIARIRGDSPPYETHCVQYKINDHMKDDRTHSTVVHVTERFTTVDDIPEMVAICRGHRLRNIEIVGVAKLDG